MTRLFLCCENTQSVCHKPFLLNHIVEFYLYPTVGTVTYNGGLDPLVTNDFNFMLVISRPIRYRTDVTL